MNEVLLLLVLIVCDSLALVLLAVGDGTGGPLVPRDLAVFFFLASLFLTIVAALEVYMRYGREAVVVFVRDGSVRVGGPRTPGIGRGRKVSLLVESGQLVVIENLGQFSRILEPGLNQLVPGETVFKVISTKPKTRADTLDCVTKDGMPVGVEFEVTARLAPGATRHPGAGPQLASLGTTPQSGWSREAVLKAAYEVPNWEAAVVRSARTILREFFAKTYLDEIYDSGMTNRQAFPLGSLQDKVRARLSEASRRWGTTIVDFHLVQVKLPPEIAKATIAVWQSRHQEGAQAPADGQTAVAAFSLPRAPLATLRLLPVIRRGPATSLREAVRSRLADVHTGDVLIEGKRFRVEPLGDSADSEVSLRQDNACFALQAHGSNLLAVNVADGDYVLFESQEFASHEDVVAVLVDAQVTMKRYWKKTHHVLLGPDSAGDPPVVLSDDLAMMEALKQQYVAHDPPVEFRLATDVKVLGRGVVVLKKEGDVVPASVEDLDAAQQEPLDELALLARQDREPA